MLIEKTLKEALADYIKGKPVTVLWTKDDGSMDVRLLSDILEQEGTDDCNREATPAGRTEKDGSTTPPPHRAGFGCDSGRK